MANLLAKGVWWGKGNGNFSNLLFFLAFEIGLATHWLSNHEVVLVLKSEAHSKKTLE